MLIERRPIARLLGLEVRLLAPMRLPDTWAPSQEVPPGAVEVTATVWYSKLVSSVVEFLGVPAEEAEAVMISQHTTVFKVK